MINGINIYSILATIAMILLGYAVSYVKTRSDLIAKAGSLINEAEEDFKDTTHAGAQKFEAVCSWLADMVPTPLKPFITKAMISEIVQKVFDQAKSFADKQLDKIVDHVVKKEPEVAEKIEVAVAEEIVAESEATDEANED